MIGSKPPTPVLQARDYRLLRAVANLRVIDRQQAKLVAPFQSTTRANTRLLTLTRNGLLTRHAVGTVAGGHKFLYALTTAGARLIDMPYHGKPWSDHTHLAGSLGLEHQLRVNDLYLVLFHHPIPIPGVTVRHWQTFVRPLSATAPVKPDAYAEVDTVAGPRAWFVEVDRGTESRRRWITKAKQYVEYASSGQFTFAGDIHQFGVLVIAPSARRVHSLRATVANITEKLFWFGTFAVLDPNTFWTNVWSRPTHPGPMSLIPDLCASARTAIA